MDEWREGGVEEEGERKKDRGEGERKRGEGGMEGERGREHVMSSATNR